MREQSFTAVYEDCWYGIPCAWLEVILRLLTLMAILLFLFVTIHFTIGEIPQLEPFSKFLDEVHRITDASELGLRGHVARDEGLYSPHEEKDDGLMESRAQDPLIRNVTQLRDLPHEIYKSNDDNDAYFITFREICDDKLSADEHTEGMAEKVTPAARKVLPKSKRLHVGGESNFFKFTGEENDDRHAHSNQPTIVKHSVKLGSSRSGGPANYREEMKPDANDDIELEGINEPLGTLDIAKNSKTSMDQVSFNNDHRVHSNHQNIAKPNVISHHSGSLNYREEINSNSNDEQEIAGINRSGEPLDISRNSKPTMSQANYNDEHHARPIHQAIDKHNGQVMQYRNGGFSNYREDMKTIANDEQDPEFNGPGEPLDLLKDVKPPVDPANFNGEPESNVIHSSRVLKTQHSTRDTKADDSISSLGISDRQNVIEPDGDMNNDHYATKSVPKLKLLTKDQPKTLDVRIDMNSVKSDSSALREKTIVGEGAGGELDGISLDEGDVEVVNSDEAKKFLKEKISSEIWRKENEIIGRLGAKSSANQNAAYLDGASRLQNASNPSRRSARAVEMIDRSITYTEHERTMKQEVEVTYRRAQEIAKAILKTSEAIANSLDLCRKPISTNFISDEPLTEAENIIDQIVGQLKESLELTMGCRTCVKPHKDLMLFLRWLIFDDVSIKLCPSKPKAADLRKNYLLFNHDNMFPGRVCQPNEFPKAPFNCSASGDVNAQNGGDDGKPGDVKATGVKKKGIVSKRRHKSGNNNIDVGGNSDQKNDRA